MASVPELAHGMPVMQRMEMPPFIENVFAAPDRFHSIAAMMGLDQPTDDDDDTDDNGDTDEGTGTDNETADGQSAAKKSRKESDGAENHVAVDNNGVDGDSAIDDLSNHPNNNRDVLPDLPQPKPVAERRPGEFTAQEHIFLAWAKTMSTFTAKRQATIKMKINKIMSEAEFEDLDDEFFAGKKLE